MNLFKRAVNRLVTHISPNNRLTVKHIKKFNYERNDELFFGIDYPQLTKATIKGPFAIQGWVWGKLQIESIEVSLAGAVLTSAPIAIPRPDVAKLFSVDQDHLGFFCHLNPYLLPEKFELQLNAITSEAKKILLCTISGKRPALETNGLAPLLLTTLGRTGSTMLLGTLGMHPKVAVYKPFEQEARYIGYYMQMFKTLSSAYSWQAPLVHISEYVTQDQLLGRGMPTDSMLHYRVYSEIWDSFYHQHVPDLFKFCTSQLSQLYQQVAKINGNDTPQFMAEKFVPGNEVIEVKALFPAAKEIVLVRDPRDVYCSILSFMEKEGYQGFGREYFQDNHSYLTIALIPNIMLLYQYWKTHNDSVLLVRYEDIILEPKQTFRKICQHLGIDSTDNTIYQMLAKVSETNVDMQKKHQTSSSVINSIGRYKVFLSQNDIQLMNNLLHEALTGFGYDLSGVDIVGLAENIEK